MDQLVGPLNQAVQGNEMDTEQSEVTVDSNTCRICFEHNNEVTNLFMPWKQQWDGMAETVAEDLNKLTNIVVSEIDTHSKHICVNCLLRLQQAREFVIFACANNAVLLGNSNENNNWPKPIQVEAVCDTSMEIEIKQEQLSDNEVDNDEAVETYNDHGTVIIKIEPEEIITPLPVISSVFNEGSYTPYVNVVTHRQLYNFMQQHRFNMKSRKMSDKLTLLASHILSTNTYTDSEKITFKKVFGNFSRRFREGWVQAHRKKKRFVIQNSDWLEETFPFQVANLHNCASKENCYPAECGLGQKVPSLPLPNDIEYTDTEFLDPEVKEEPLCDDDIPSNIKDPSQSDCILCSKTFKSVSGLKAHVIAQHSYKSVLKRKVEGDAPSLNKRPPAKHVCATCRRSFTTSTDLMVHESSHSEASCYRCHMKFPSFSLLLRHRRKCTAKPEQAKRITLHDVQRPVADAAESREDEDVNTKAKINGNSEDRTLPGNNVTLDNALKDTTDKANSIYQEKVNNENANDSEIPEKIFKCPECQETFSQDYYLKIHKEILHNNMDTTSGDSFTINVNGTKHLQLDNNALNNIQGQVVDENLLENILGV